MKHTISLSLFTAFAASFAFAAPAAVPAAATDKPIAAASKPAAEAPVPSIWDKTYLTGKTDKDPIAYAPGEEMVFTITLDGAPDPLPEGYKVRWSRTGDDGEKKGGELSIAELAAKPLVVRTSLDRPGFVFVKAELFDQNRKRVMRSKKPGQNRAFAVAFEGGAGVDVDKISFDDEPADFDAFWKRQKERLAKVPIKILKQVKVDYKPEAKCTVYAMAISCAGPRPVTGYLSIPDDDSHKYRAVVSFHGYGTNKHVPPSWFSAGAGIRFDVNAHGMELPAFGVSDDYYEKFFASIKNKEGRYAFDPVENADPETAYFNGMALRVMRAIEFIKTLPQWDGKTLEVSGGSQGGLQTMWAAGLCDGITKAKPNIPWCCNMGAPVQAPRLHAGWYPEFTPALRYYDIIYHAKRVPATSPVIIDRAGLGDYTCPPSGVAMLYNNLRCPKSIHWVQGSTHGYVPPEPRQVSDRKSGLP